MIPELLLWLSVAVIFHSYILFPLILKILSSNKKPGTTLYSRNEDLPFVSILMSAFNEEDVIAGKIESVFQTRYPADKLELVIGSDHSTDHTNAIVESQALKYNGLKFFPFGQRQGKGNVINQLFEKSLGTVIILTDANVIFDPDTIPELVKYFKDPKIGLVDSNMINKGLTHDGISVQEKAYISREVMIKYREGLIWGAMMGPFGGCYAIRKELYTQVPKNFLVDDFYINMQVLEKGYRAINNLDAKVYEDVSNNLSDEFRRKVRIATGNFQNLATFGHLLFPLHTGISFSFLSHKVLRWLGPFFILAAFFANLYLAFGNRFYLFLFHIQCLLFLLPGLDYVLRKIKIHNVLLRFITHFYSMNAALLSGFFKFIKGVESNVWKPTKRHQTR